MASEKTPVAGLTFVVLICNRRELLRGCMESLFAQDDPGILLQFIVIDDGSNNGTGDMMCRLTATQPQWKYIFQDHKGIAAARNVGIGNNRTTAVFQDSMSR
jgi:glycosyltransferase involved in cell wall biosynthesis